MYADIIIDISHEQLDRTFQYIIPEELEEKITVGSSVNIPFGKGNRIISGFVVGITDKPSYDVNKLKAIDSILTEKLGAAGNMIKLAEWLKVTFGSTMNQALKVVLPVKDKVKLKEKKSIRLELGEEEARSHLEIYRKKNAKAKVRLLEALIDEPVIDSGLVRDKLNISPSTIKSMEDAGILSIVVEEYYRNPVKEGTVTGKKIILNDIQQNAVDRIISDYEGGERKTYLIHGVTGSGKTEVYLDVIEKVIADNKQVIMLIPEIALTFQTVQRFYHRFGDKVSILNSRMSKGERYDQFLRAMRGEISIMIGPRSALFTPFSNLGLIVIDEEHEGAYKSEVSPRYHARPTAIHIAKEAGAFVILGSATPSVESFYKASTGEYELITLSARAGEGKLPTVHTVDLREELRLGNRSIFSAKLSELIRDRLNKKEQTMLFLNKRGIAGFISCRACGYVVKCPHCDVSMTEHNNGQMVCHYCGYTIPKVNRCPKCNSKYIAGFRAGTEAIEKLVNEQFPEAKTLRMDMDTTKGKDGHEKILSIFANGEADILIGTQMIVKGHDFPNVTLVGIIAADMSLYANDYQATEKTFQLLTQAAGRAGRAEKPGEVVIQTYSPEHFSIEAAAKQDYASFYEQEIAYRGLLKYPPVNCMMKIMLSGADENVLQKNSDLVKKKIDQCLMDKSIKGVFVLGPTNAAIYKIADIYYKIVYIRCADRSVLENIHEEVESFVSNYVDSRQIAIQYDIT